LLVPPNVLQVGLLRGGRFLAEQSPDELLETYMCDTLEDVFLKLSKVQNQGKRRRSSYMLEIMGPPKPEEGPSAFDTTSEISGEYGDSISLSSKDVNPVTSSELDMPPEEGKKMGYNGLSQVSVTTQDEGCHMEGLLVDVEECWCDAVYHWTTCGTNCLILLVNWSRP